MQLTPTRLQAQIQFIVEIDQLKHVLRQTILMDKSRRENDAEHSWHLAMMAIVLSEYADPQVDLLRVLKMVLIQDLVEIDAGDTFCYDAIALQDQAEREEKAANRLFGLLPDGKERDRCLIKTSHLCFSMNTNDSFLFISWLLNIRYPSCS